MLNRPPPILIAGATASGKSALALALAKRLGGVIINADSMQVYDALPILTAQPAAAERDSVPHKLYGHIPAAAPYSVAHWLSDLAPLLTDVAATKQRPILVGGTGLYLRAALHGLSPVPAVPEDVRAAWRTAGREWPAATLHSELARRDPVMAARLRPSDRQRVVRALEVIDGTGRSLAQWHDLPGTPLLPEASVRLLVMLDRQVLRERCDARFDAMLAAGVLEEVAAFAARGVPAVTPIRGALGLAPLLDYLAGKVSLAVAAETAKAATRQYAKRQITWARRFMADWRIIGSDILVDPNQLDV